MIKKVLIFVISFILCICLVSCNDTEEEQVKNPDYPPQYNVSGGPINYFHRIFYEYEDGILKNNIIRVGFARRQDYSVPSMEHKGEIFYEICNIKISLQVDSFTDTPASAIYTYEISLEDFVSDEYAVSGYYPELKDFKKTYDFSITELIENENVEVQEGLCIMITYDWYDFSSDIAYVIDQVNLYGKTVNGKFVLDSVWETIHLPTIHGFYEYVN